VNVSFIWFSPFFWGGAVALYVLGLRLWQPANPRTLAYWRMGALALAIVGSYSIHAMLLPPIAPAGSVL
jgi:hypothetical protein